MAIAPFLSLEPAAAQDTVYLSSPTSSQGFTRVSGRVVDYTSAGLVIASGGSERVFPAEQVARIETPRTASERQAEALMEAGDFPAALAAYRKARDEEPRAWVRREITSRIVWCCRALGQLTTAADEFLLLVRADAASPYFPCIPLAWDGTWQSAALEQSARTWIRQEEIPAAVLLGASYLLPTELGGAAIDRLQNLAKSPDQTIARLALLQSWRTLVVSVDTARVESWEATVDSMPPALRAGGYFLVGQGWARCQQWEKAALALMRIPILHPLDRQLAARALLDAGAALEKLNRGDSAAQLYRELVDQYPESPWVSEAQNRLNAAGPSAPRDRS